jgi:hypothetical protein
MQRNQQGDSVGSNGRSILAEPLADAGEDQLSPAVRPELRTQACIRRGDPDGKEALSIIKKQVSPAMRRGTAASAIKKKSSTNNHDTGGFFLPNVTR